MGQKTHPTGFRVGIIEPWVSTWFAKKGQYAQNIAQDAQIRKFIKRKYIQQVFHVLKLQERQIM